MSMYKTLRVFEIKVLEKKVCILNWHMRMYKYVAMVVFLCAVLTSGTDWFGDPIECMAQDPVPEAIFTSFCYMEDSLSYEIKDQSPEYSRVTKPAYYQWVWLLLSLHSFLTYLPYLAWKYLEGGKLARLVIKTGEENQSPVSIGKFLSSQRNWYSGQATCFLICEILCLPISISQVFLIDMFLGGDVVNSITNWPPPVFPMVVKCNMPYIGPGGSIREHNSICTLAYSALHEKIYIVVISLFLMLIMLSTIYTVLHIFLLVAPAARIALIKVKVGNLYPNRHLGKQIGFCSYGEFILLMFISKNIGPQEFSELMNVYVENRGETEAVNNNRRLNKNYEEQSRLKHC